MATATKEGATKVNLEMSFEEAVALHKLLGKTTTKIEREAGLTGDQCQSTLSTFKELDNQLRVGEPE